MNLHARFLNGGATLVIDWHGASVSIETSEDNRLLCEMIMRKVNLPPPWTREEAMLSALDAAFRILQDSVDCRDGRILDMRDALQEAYGASGKPPFDSGGVESGHALNRGGIPARLDDLGAAHGNKIDPRAGVASGPLPSAVTT